VIYSWRGHSGAGRYANLERVIEKRYLSSGQSGDCTMLLPRTRFTTRWMMLLAVGATAMSAVLLAAPLKCPAQATHASPSARMTLLGTLSEWKYPGSKMLARDVRHPPSAERRTRAFCVLGCQTPTFCGASDTRLLRLGKDQRPWFSTERAGRE